MCEVWYFCVGGMILLCAQHDTFVCTIWYLCMQAWYFCVRDMMLLCALFWYFSVRGVILLCARHDTFMYVVWFCYVPGMILLCAQLRGRIDAKSHPVHQEHVQKLRKTHRNLKSADRYQEICAVCTCLEHITYMIYSGQDWSICAFVHRPRMIIKTEL